MTTSFVVHPQKLKKAIGSLIGFAHFSLAAERQYNVPDIMLTVTRTNGRAGELSIVGLSMYTAGRLILDVDSVDGDDVSEVLVPAKTDGKSDVVNDLKKLSAGITGTAKDAQAFMEIAHRERLTVENKGVLVGEIADSGAPTNKHVWVEDMLDKGGYQPLDSALALSLDTISRLSELSAVGPVADLAQIPGNQRIVAAQVGESFTGIMSAIDREVFAKGGPHGNGEGTPKSLFDM